MEVKDILEQRQETHGDFGQGAKFTQEYKREMRSISTYCQLTYSQKEAADMIIHKLARVMVGDFKWLDSWYDIIGYSQLVVNIMKEDILPEPFFALNPAIIYETINGVLIERYQLAISTQIVSMVSIAIANPASVKPWKDIIKLAQYIIDDLESKGEKRVQR